MDIDRTQFEFSHGRLPRGEGSWAFMLGRNGAWTQFWFNGKFGDALAAAKREARSVGATSIVVQP